jgi:hypothetical protein
MLVAVAGTIEDEVAARFLHMGQCVVGQGFDAGVGRLRRSEGQVGGDAPRQRVPGRETGVVMRSTTSAESPANAPVRGTRSQRVTQLSFQIARCASSAETV